MQSYLAAFRWFVKLARFENTLLPSFTIYAGALAVHSKLSLLPLQLIAFILAHSIVTIWNDITDEATDVQNKIQRIATVKKLGLYRLLMIWLCIALLVLMAVSLFLPLDNALLLAIYAFLGWTYNAAGFQASHRPVSSIGILAVAYGTIPFLLGSGISDFTWKLLLLAVGLTLCRGSLSILKDYKDAPGDAKTNKRTFLLIYGNRLTIRVSIAVGIAGYVITIVGATLFKEHRILTLFILISVAGWLCYERLRLHKATDYAKLDKLFHTYLEHELLFIGGLIVCLRIH